MRSILLCLILTLSLHVYAENGPDTKSESQKPAVEKPKNTEKQPSATEEKVKISPEKPKLSPEKPKANPEKPKPVEKGSETLSKKSKASTDKQLRLADELESQGDADGALKVLEALSQKAPDDIELSKRIVRLQMSLNRFSDAAEKLQQILEAEGGTEEDYLAVANMLIDTNTYKKAILLLNSAAKRFPNSASIPYFLTYALSGEQEWEAAIAQFKKTISLSKDGGLNEDAAFYFRYASANERAGHFEDAVALFQKTLRLLKNQNPSDRDPERYDEFLASVQNYLAYMWIERGENLEEAGKLALSAYQLDSENGAIADTVGWFHFQNKNYPMALVELKKAEKLIEEADPVIFDHIGQTLQKLNENEFAANYYKKALSLDPDNAEIKARLDKVKK